MELNYKAIGNRIRKARKAKGITQQILAELSEQEPSNISHIERGATKVSLPTLIRIANALNTTLDNLVCDNLPHAKYVFTGEIAAIIDQCNEKEIRLIADMSRALIESARRNEIV